MNYQYISYAVIAIGFICVALIWRKNNKIYKDYLASKTHAEFCRGYNWAKLENREYISSIFYDLDENIAFDRGVIAFMNGEKMK